MKQTRLLIITVSLLLCISLFSSIGYNTKTADQEYYAKYRQHKMKHDGNLPKMERRPNDWFYIQRAYPNESIPAGKQLKGIEDAKELRKEVSANKAITYSAWSNVGPTNIPGRITDIDAEHWSEEHVYAASAAGGVFKITNGALPWQSIFDEAGVQSIGDVTIHPWNPNIIYVGTGEANNATDNYEGTGVYKSIDGGATWEYKGLPNSFHIPRIVIDPEQPETVFVAVMGKCWGMNPERGVYRSQDGGDTWEQVLYVSDSTGCTDIGIYRDGSSEGVHLVATFLERIRTPARRTVGGITSGVYYSSDAGDNWTPLNGTGGLPASSYNIGRIGVDINTTTGLTYLLYADANGHFTGIYINTLPYISDWTNYDPLNQIYDLNGSWDGGWYFGNVRGATYDFGTVYALGLELYRREQTGNWSEVTNGMHVDMHAMWIDPSNNDHLFCGNDGGVYESNNSGSGWTHLNDMANTQFYAIEIDPNQPFNYFGGTQDNGTLMGYSNNPDLWDRILGGDGFYVVVDYINSNIIYAEYQNGYLTKSVDDGSIFYYAMNGIDYDNERHNWVTPIVMDPKNHNVLYYGSNKLYRSEDAAGFWAAISGDLTNGPYPGNLGLGTITTIDVSPVDNDIIYVGTDDGLVWRSTNNGTDWTQINSGLPNRWVTRVTADPIDQNVVYVTLSGYKEGLSDAHAYRSSNQGAIWTSIDGDIP
ncbi:MAG: hypothetical protein ABIJ45_12965, partial [Candidatus Zixiibacteriota bacterium]